MTRDDDIALARQHVLTGHRIIARQLLLIQDLRALGYSTDGAEETLKHFTQSQAIFEEHLATLLNQKR